MQQVDPCGTCSGDGRVRRKKSLSLKIPAGVDTDSRLRVRGEGNAGRKGGPAGDLYVFIRVKADPELRRDGSNVLVSAKISYLDAILGTTVKVKTVDGPVELKIPAGEPLCGAVAALLRGVTSRRPAFDVTGGPVCTRGGVVTHPDTPWAAAREGLLGSAIRCHGLGVAYYWEVCCGLQANFWNQVDPGNVLCAAACGECSLSMSRRLAWIRCNQHEVAAGLGRYCYLLCLLL